MGRPRKKKAADLEWYVFYYNVNKNKIEPFNIFRHGGFCEYVDKARKKCKTREEFVEQVRKELKYYFWSKSEYELIIEVSEDGTISLSPWCGCRNPEEVTIDVTYQNPEWKWFAEAHINKQRYGNKAKIDIYDQVIWVWTEFSIWLCDELGVK